MSAFFKCNTWLCSLIVFCELANFYQVQFWTPFCDWILWELNNLLRNFAFIWTILKSLAYQCRMASAENQCRGSSQSGYAFSWAQPFLCLLDYIFCLQYLIITAQINCFSFIYLGVLCPSTNKTMVFLQGACIKFYNRDCLANCVGIWPLCQCRLAKVCLIIITSVNRKPDRYGSTCGWHNVSYGVPYKLAKHQSF